MKLRGLSFLGANRGEDYKRRDLGMQGFDQPPPFYKKEGS